MYCLCVNVYCHRVTTQLQVINIMKCNCKWRHMEIFSKRISPIRSSGMDITWRVGTTVNGQGLFAGSTTRTLARKLLRKQLGHERTAGRGLHVLWRCAGDRVAYLKLQRTLEKLRRRGAWCYDLQLRRSHLRRRALPTHGRSRGHSNDDVSDRRKLSLARCDHFHQLMFFINGLPLTSFLGVVWPMTKSLLQWPVQLSKFVDKARVRICCHLSHLALKMEAISSSET
jgi:hypothetical protein